MSNTTQHPTIRRAAEIIFEKKDAETVDKAFDLVREKTSEEDFTQVVDALEKIAVQSAYDRADAWMKEDNNEIYYVDGKPSLEQFFKINDDMLEALLAEGETPEDFEIDEDDLPDADNDEAREAAAEIRADMEELKQEKARRGAVCQIFLRVAEIKGDETGPLTQQVVRILDRTPAVIRSFIMEDIELRAYLESGAGAHRVWEARQEKLSELRKRQPKFRIIP